MKRKVRKFSQGGYGDSFSEDFGMGTREEMIERNIEDNERRRQAEQLKPATTVEEFEEPGTAGFSRAPVKPPPVASKSSAPRSKPTVTKPAAQKPSAPQAGQSAPMGRTAMGKTAEQEMAALEAGRKARGKAEIERLQKEDKPLEQVTPEKNLIGGVPLRGAKAMASGLKEMGSYLKNRFGKDAAPNVAGRLGSSGKKAETLTKDMGPVEYAAGKRSMLQNQKGEGVITPPANPFPERNKRMLLQNQRGEGVITPPAKPFPERNKRRLLNKNSRSDDTIEMGMKSGGKVSSASRRGDGIASRGKTRGRYI